MTYLVIGAVLFAIGVRLGYWLGKDDGYHLAMHEFNQRQRFSDIVRRARTGGKPPRSYR